MGLGEVLKKERFLSVLSSFLNMKTLFKKALGAGSRVSVSVKRDTEKSVFRAWSELVYPPCTLVYPSM